MSSNIMRCALPIGDFDWFPLKQIGDKYFMLATKPLFKGYYSLEPSDFAHSRLQNFLNVKFLAFLKDDGIDTTNITGMSILTQGQYNLYVYNKLPKCSEYLLQTIAPNQPNKVLAAQPDGSLAPVTITTKTNIRPCFFIDAEYLQSITESPILTTEEYFTNIRKEEEAAQAVAAAAAAKAAEEAAQLAAEQEAKIPEAVPEKTVEEIQQITPIVPLPNVIEPEPVAENTEVSEPKEQQPESEIVPEPIQPTEPESAPEPVAPEAQPEVAPIPVAVDIPTIVPPVSASTEVQSTAETVVDEPEVEKTIEETVDVGEKPIEATGLTVVEDQTVEANTEPDEEPAVTDLVAVDEPAAAEHSSEIVPAVEESPVVVAPVIDKPVTSTSNLIIDEPTAPSVEYLSGGRKIENDHNGTHAVYVYQGEYKDYAFLVTEGDEKLQKSIEKMGISIRAYMQSATNEQRNPMDKSNVADHISRLQNRWRW